MDLKRHKDHPNAQRVNRRRVGRHDSHGRCGPSVPARPPPALIRQSERKHNFVDNLVDAAAQIVEAIWPLASISCHNGSSYVNRNVLPLTTFIRETLRRSKTSYSTLQVALYYLVRIKPHLPPCDFTMEQVDDSPAIRALQCGRRMFLASLILASKYLQDRNYSARAWSKISGLSTQEITMNEMTFLTAINWRLHVTEAVFQRWTDIMLRYTSIPMTMTTMTTGIATAAATTTASFAFSTAAAAAAAASSLSSMSSASSMGSASSASSVSSVSSASSVSSMSSMSSLPTASRPGLAAMTPPLSAPATPATMVQCPFPTPPCSTGPSPSSSPPSSVLFEARKPNWSAIIGSLTPELLPLSPASSEDAMSQPSLASGAASVLPSVLV